MSIEWPKLPKACVVTLFLHNRENNNNNNNNNKNNNNNNQL